MDIVVLVLWMFNAAAGLCLLVTSNLSRGHLVPDAEPAQVTTPAKVAAVAESASAAEPAEVAPSAKAAAPARAGRASFDPPSLVRAKNEPIPGLRPLLEFTHPALAVTGFGFWAGYTLTHNRILAVIAFGVLVATVCAGLSWFAGNTREARRRPHDESAPSFSPRLVVLHGAGAALTFLLAALVAARM